MIETENFKRELKNELAQLEAIYRKIDADNIKPSDKSISLSGN